MIARISTLSGEKHAQALKLLEVWWKGREMPTLASAKAAALSAREAELAATDSLRARWLADPTTWVKDKLGEHLWSKQREVFTSVRDNRRTAVHSCHAIGKSFTASRIACWWIESHRPGEAYVVSSAPTDSQVRAILWRELGRAHAKGGLQGRMNQTEWHVTMPAGNEEMVAYGRKPADLNPTAFQGIHAPYVLVIMDEACHDEQTDVMTDSGWKRFADLSSMDRLLTMDPATHKSVYRSPERIIKRKYTGRMYSYSATGCDFCVTPDHSMYVHNLSNNRQWKCIRADQIQNTHNLCMRKTILWDAPDIETFMIPEWRGERKYVPARAVPMDDWLRFLSWFTSEGNLLRGGKSKYTVGVAISQKDPVVREEIFDLCSRLGFNPKRSYIQILIASTWLARHLEELGQNCIERTIPQYARNVSIRQLNIFLDIYVLGDGYHKSSGRDIIYTSSPRMADALQEMILKTGRPSVIRRREIAGQKKDLGTHIATSSVDGFVVSRAAVDTEIKLRPENHSCIDYDGYVYCATVSPEHLLLTRRNGYSMWSGNCGIAKTIHEAADTLISNENSRILNIGNPDDINTEFGENCKPGSGWNVIGVSALDSPNFTGEWVPEIVAQQLISPVWVEEKRRKWGEDNPLYISKVLGQFPERSTSGLIPIAWIRAAQLRDLSGGVNLADLRAGSHLGPAELGVDVGAGGDKNVIAHRRGPVVRVIREDSQPDTMISCGNLIQDIARTGASLAKIDYIGVGRGLVDRAKEQSAPVRGVSVSSKAIDPEHYANLRAEGFWGLRERFETGDIDIDPDDEDLAAQLANIKRKPTSAGKEQIVSKKDSGVATREMRQDARSPDRADAVMLAFVVPPPEGPDYPDYAIW